MPTTNNETAPSQAVEKLAYSGKELQRLLGLSVVSIWRLERRGLLRAVPGIRTKLYSRKSVEAFLEGKSS